MAVLVVIETWDKCSLKFKFDYAKTAQSPPYHRSGVMIVFTKQFYNVAHINSNAWTEHTITVRANLKNSKASIYNICHYPQPGNRQVLDDELNYHVKTIKQRQPGAHIVVAGDIK